MGELRDRNRSAFIRFAESNIAGEVYRFAFADSFAEIDADEVPVRVGRDHRNALPSKPAPTIRSVAARSGNVTGIASFHAFRSAQKAHSARN